MAKLVPITPMGAYAPQVDRVGAVTIAEVFDRALASVAGRMGREAGAAAGLAALCGTDAPGPGKWAAGAEWALIWTAPGQWFADAPFASHEDIAARLKSALGADASVTEQTDGWARFRIAGAGVVAMLQRLCPVDGERMQAGDATRSMIEHLGALVICRAGGAEFDILCPRSGAGSLHHALMAAARSIA